MHFRQQQKNLLDPKEFQYWMSFKFLLKIEHCILAKRQNQVERTIIFQLHLFTQCWISHTPPFQGQKLFFRNRFIVVVSSSLKPDTSNASFLSISVANSFGGDPLLQVFRSQSRSQQYYRSDLCGNECLILTVVTQKPKKGLWSCIFWHLMLVFLIECQACVLHLKQLLFQVGQK